MVFHNQSTLMNMSKIIPDRNKVLSRVVDQNTKKSYESTSCSRLAMVCCRYVIEQTEVTTHLDRIYRKYV